MYIKTAKEQEYDSYVKKHINNVKKAFNNRLYAIKNALQLTDEEVEELRNRILKHDESKYSKEEFEPYRKWFYPETEDEKNKDEFDKAFKHHYTVNDHHPEYWNGHDMTKVAIAELICDWESMSINFGGNPLEYFEKERFKKKKVMSENTFKIIDNALHSIYDINMNLKE